MPRVVKRGNGVKRDGRYIVFSYGDGRKAEVEEELLKTAIRTIFTLNAADKTTHSPRIVIDLRPISELTLKVNTQVYFTLEWEDEVYRFYYYEVLEVLAGI